MKPTLLVLAAGMGSRFGGIKQLDGIGPNGETIMDYSIFDAKRSGFDKVVFIIREELLSDFEEIVVAKFKGQIEIDYVFQKTENLPSGYELKTERQKPWGTAHAVWCAKDQVTAPFAVINADDFYGRESFEIIFKFLSSRDAQDISEQCIIGYQLQKTLSEHGSVSRAICEVDGQDYLKAIVERTNIVKRGSAAAFIENDEEHPLSGMESVSMNMIGLTPAIFPKIEEDLLHFLKTRGDEAKAEFYLPIVLNNLIEQSLGKVKVLPTNANWFGMTYKEDREEVVSKVNKLIEEGVYPSSLWD